MTNRTAKRRALVAVAFCYAFFSLTNEANAEVKEWGSLSDLTYDASIYPDGTSAVYVANSVTFKDRAGNVLTNNHHFSFVYFTYQTIDQQLCLGIAGGLDGFGTSARGWFNQLGQYDYGMTNNQTANYPNVDNGYWEGFIDLNGDGNYGTYDSSNGMFLGDPYEYIGNKCVSNFQPFQTGQGPLSAGDITGEYEPSVGLPITTFQLTHFAYSNQTSFTVATTKTFNWWFTIQYCDSLTNGAWQYVNSYYIPAFGDVVSVSCVGTNKVPMRFYRAVSP